MSELTELQYDATAYHAPAEAGGPAEEGLSPSEFELVLALIPTLTLDEKLAVLEAVTNFIEANRGGEHG